MARPAQEKKTCEVCGTPTTKRYRVFDPRVKHYYMNSVLMDGPSPASLCSASCAKDTLRFYSSGSRKLPKGWRIEQEK